MRSVAGIWVLGAVALAAVSGCASVAPTVVALGPDAYQVSAIGAPYESQADTNFKAIRAANEHCDQMGKSLLFRQSIESSDHRWSPKQEDLTFVCRDAKDPAFMRASLRQDPTVAKE